jgi:hypothetical protein
MNIFRKKIENFTKELCQKHNLEIETLKIGGKKTQINFVKIELKGKID